MLIESAEVGRIRVADVPLPEGVREPSATYSASGSVLVLHRTGEHRYALSALRDDGSHFRTVFEGEIAPHPKANGIRHMPFADNRRVLLGDWVLECSPDIDTCTRAELVPVDYPWGLADDPLTSHHWSEIIVAPDGEHMAWTMLRVDMGAAAAWGRLRRTGDRYVIEDPVLISSPAELAPDPAHEGCLIPLPALGGEVKQFVRGGAAISAVGSAGGFLPDSVIQSLEAAEVTAITRTPGYDETTILSPDERLGLVMTSRASATTDPAVLGLLPRPLAALSGRGASWAAYFYTVDGVRRFRRGSIGPVLIDVARSQADGDYRGTSLADPGGDWVYVSPMSWHPSGTRAMWMETLRGTLDEQPVLRIRTANLLDHEPGEPVAPRPDPPAVPYGIRGARAEQLLRTPPAMPAAGRILGRHAGHALIEREAGDLRTGRAARTSVTYTGFSDDGRTFYDGTETTESSFATGTVFTADLQATGETEGEMRLRMTWSGIADGTRLLFDRADDGLPRSYGFARLADERREVADLVP